MAPEASEELWVITTPLEEAVAAALDGRITDSLTVAGLLALAARGRGARSRFPAGGAP
jgi:8-oxo-dGDP phosphatase